MKILIDGRPIRSPITGSARIIIDLVQSLVDLGIRPTIFFQDDCGNNSNSDLLSKDVKLFKTSNNKSIENILYEFGINIKKTTFNADEFILHETYFARLPFNGHARISTINDIIPIDFPDWYPQKINFFSKKNFKRQSVKSDYLIFSSHHTFDKASKYYNYDNKYSIIHPGVSFDIQKNCKSYFNLFSDTQKNFFSDIYGDFILILGNIEPRKNIPFVARAVSILNAKYKLNLNIVVAGKMLFNFEKIINESLKYLDKDRMFLIGYINDDLKIKLLQNCACHVFASLYEGFGIPPIESLVIGAPTLIAQNSSLVEITPSKRIGFSTDDPNQLAELIYENLYLSPFKNTSIDMTTYVNYFSFKRVAADYIRIYKNYEK